MERKQEQDTTDDRQKQGNPADETVIYKIGGTFYEVSTSCGGSEPLFEKMKRLIKSENLKAPTDKGKEVRYNEDSNLSVGRSLQEEWTHDNDKLSRQYYSFICPFKPRERFGRRE